MEVVWNQHLRAVVHVLILNGLVAGMISYRVE